MEVFIDEMKKEDNRIERAPSLLYTTNMKIPNMVP